jgi:hypothetical protein
MDWTCRRTGELRNSYKDLVLKLEGKDLLEDVDGRIIFKPRLNK